MTISNEALSEDPIPLEGCVLWNRRAFMVRFMASASVKRREQEAVNHGDVELLEERMRDQGTVSAVQEHEEMICSYRSEPQNDFPCGNKSPLMVPT